MIVNLNSGVEVKNSNLLQGEKSPQFVVNDKINNVMLSTMNIQELVQFQVEIKKEIDNRNHQITELKKSVYDTFEKITKISGNGDIVDQLINEIKLNSNVVPNVPISIASTTQLSDDVEQELSDGIEQVTEEPVEQELSDDVEQVTEGEAIEQKLSDGEEQVTEGEIIEQKLSDEQKKGKSTLFIIPVKEKRYTNDYPHYYPTPEQMEKLKFHMVDFCLTDDETGCKCYGRNLIVITPKGERVKTFVNKFIDEVLTEYGGDFEGFVPNTNWTEGDDEINRFIPTCQSIEIVREIRNRILIQNDKILGIDVNEISHQGDNGNGTMVKQKSQDTDRDGYVESDVKDKSQNHSKTTDSMSVEKGKENSSKRIIMKDEKGEIVGNFKTAQEVHDLTGICRSSIAKNLSKKYPSYLHLRSPQDGNFYTFEYQST